VTPDATGSWPRPAPYDFFETTRLLPTGSGDPTVRREAAGLWRSAHAREGAVSVRLTVGEAIHADAWGPGAAGVMEDVPRWLGLGEAPWTLPAHPVTDRLLRQHRGLRGTDTRDMFEALVPVVLQQLVTWEEAATAWRRLCYALGERAPGPAGLRLSPTPRAIRAAGTARLESFGIGGRQARTLMEVARVAHAIQKAADLPTPEAASLLQKVRGIGPWSAALVLGSRFARPEPVPVGDYHLRHAIAWALAGEERATDARMLELLAPFEGHAFRVVRLVFAARIRAPRRGPKRGMR
jgi:3-methyladenine DNA glycosylase/8-oxoguanine DNA glycosylase